MQNKQLDNDGFSLYYQLNIEFFSLYRPTRINISKLKYDSHSAIIKNTREWVRGCSVDHLQQYFTVDPEPHTGTLVVISESKCSHKNESTRLYTMYMMKTTELPIVERQNLDFRNSEKLRISNINVRAKQKRFSCWSVWYIFTRTANKHSPSVPRNGKYPEKGYCRSNFKHAYIIMFKKL